MERKSVVLEATSEGAERLSDLLTLSYEPMLAWRLDGVIEFWIEIWPDAASAENAFRSGLVTWENDPHPPDAPVVY
jgi:hypothetical protein